ncbi:carbohydrate ABC transporter permease [Paenibacillus qinlingensis]|uniref:Aldouronate transport system permease protein n=1 Tax=Paenibacillus qinlingensis TaxID=1837343 RepID=A0ABU1P663_9BACL|nr:carbohydrate ABC transporter permease [Paenibacillus qinlingensis]MDR6555243.1 putative aldouronate transport system permease protein [Paenibacillus qinlingensis]
MRTSFGDRLFFGLNYGLLALIALTCLLPLLHIASLSLSHTQEILSGRVTFWPVGWNTDAFTSMIDGTRMLSAFRNSVVITVVGVALSMLVTILTAYPLSRKLFPGRRYVTLALIFTMMFTGGMIPTYLIVKTFGLVNSYWALWIPALVNTYNMLVMKTYFENIPDELEEAGKMDGCGQWRQLLQIILPLSKPVLATITLFYAVSYWNSFFNVMLYINESAKYNLAVLVQNMIQNQQLLQEIVLTGAQVEVVPESLKAASVMIMMLPMIVIYPFLQKYFVKGVMLGAVKG